MATDTYSVAPGKTQKVRVSMPSQYIRSREPYEKNDIILETSDPDNQLVRLSMKFQVVDVLVLNPATVNFGTVRPGSVNTREITVTNTSDGPITLTKISAFPETGLKVSGQEGVTIGPGKAITLGLTYTPPAPQRRFLGLLQVETNLEYLKVKTVQVRASAEKK